MDLPKGSTIVEEKIAATETAPAVARRTTTVASDTVQKTLITENQVVVSPPRPPDKSVALFEAQAKDRKVLLICAIGAAVGGIVAKGLVPAWPSVATGAWTVSGILFLAWKFAEVPWWAALFVVVIVIIMILFYKRGELDRDKDGRIDVFQRVTESFHKQPEPPLSDDRK